MQLLLRLAPNFPEPGSFALHLLPVASYTFVPPVQPLGAGAGATSAGAKAPTPLAALEKAAAAVPSLVNAARLGGEAKALVATLEGLAALLRVCTASLFCPPTLPPFHREFCVIPCLLWAAGGLLPAALQGRLHCPQAVPKASEGYELPRGVWA